MRACQKPDIRQGVQLYPCSQCTPSLNFNLQKAVCTPASRALQPHEHSRARAYCCNACAYTCAFVTQLGTMFLRPENAVSSGATRLRDKEARTLGRLLLAGCTKPSERAPPACATGGAGSGRGARDAKMAGGSSEAVAGDSFSALFKCMFPTSAVSKSKLTAAHPAPAIAYADASDGIVVAMEVPRTALLAIAQHEKSTARVTGSTAVRGGSGAAAASEVLIPTVMGTWRVPDLLPTIVMAAPASAYVLKGAALMLAGVYNSDSCPLPDYEKGDVVALRAAGNPLPFAIGIAAASAADARMNNMHGVGFRIVQAYRDALWAACGRIVPNEGFMQAVIRPLPGVDLHLAFRAGAEEATLSEDEDSGEASACEEEPRALLPAVTAGLRALDLAAAAAGEAETHCRGGDDIPTASSTSARGRAAAGGRTHVATDSSTAAGAGAAADAATFSTTCSGTHAATPTTAPAAVTSHAVPSASVDATAGGHVWSTWDAGTLLTATLVQACQRRIKDAHLPMLVNVLYGTHMQAVRPVGSTLNPKATPWKRTGAFFEAMADAGLLKLARAGKKEDAVLSVTGINRSHDLYVAHRRWPMTMEVAGAAEIDGTGATASAPASAGSLSADAASKVRTAAAGASSGMSATTTGVGVGMGSSHAVGAAGASDETGVPSDYIPPLLLELYEPRPCLLPILRSQLAAHGVHQPWAPRVAVARKAVEERRPALCQALLQLAAAQTAPAARTKRGPASKSASASAASVPSAGGDVDAVASTFLRCSPTRANVGSLLITKADMGSALAAYISDHALVPADSKAHVTLDALLQEALFGRVHVDSRLDLTAPGSHAADSAADPAALAGSGEGAREVEEAEAEEEEEGEVEETGGDHAAAPTLLRSDATARWAARWTPVRMLIFPSPVTGAAEVLGPYKSSMPRVVVCSRFVAGNKATTFVVGLHMFHIDAAAFARSASKKCAGSASVTTDAAVARTASGIVPGGLHASALAGAMVQVQGSVVQPLVDMLTAPRAKSGYGLPIECIAFPDASTSAASSGSKKPRPAKK